MHGDGDAAPAVADDARRRLDGGGLVIGNGDVVPGRGALPPPHLSAELQLHQLRLWRTTARAVQHVPERQPWPAIHFAAVSLGRISVHAGETARGTCPTYGCLRRTPMPTAGEQNVRVRVPWRWHSHDEPRYVGLNQHRPLRSWRRPWEYAPESVQRAAVRCWSALP